MNVIGYGQPSFQRPARRPRLHRIDTVTLASSVSIVAVLTAASLHVFASVAEQPLVVGTILLASIASWVNASLPAERSTPHDGGQHLAAHGFGADTLDELDTFDELDHPDDVYERAA